MFSLICAYVFVRSVTQVETALLNNSMKNAGSFPFIQVVQSLLNITLLIFCFLIPLIVNSTFFHKGIGPLVKTYEFLNIRTIDRVLGVLLGILWVVGVVALVFGIYLFVGAVYLPVPAQQLVILFAGLLSFILFVSSFNLFIAFISESLIFSFLFSTLSNYALFFTGDFYLTVTDNVVKNVLSQFSIPYHFSQFSNNTYVWNSFAFFIGLTALFIYFSYRFESLKKWVR